MVIVYNLTTRTMNKTIETKFFEAFKLGGVVNQCIDWMRYTYNLPPMKPTEKENEQLQNGREKAANETREKLYNEEMTKRILKAAEDFDDSVIYADDSPLMNEIEANLKECQTDAQKKRYLFSLLKPFVLSGCGFARVFTPIAEINQLNKQIEELEKSKTNWQAMPQDEQLKDEDGEPWGTPKEQVEACTKEIKRLKEQIEWERHVNNRFVELTCSASGENPRWLQDGTVENCLHAFVHFERTFANRLDALLLTYGIDLMELQKESGLYLKAGRLTEELIPYIGSKKLAQKYIDALQKEPQQQASHKSNRSKGRPKKSLKDMMIDDADGNKLEKLQRVMAGKTGKDAALIILACIKKGWMSKPTFKQVTEKFSNIGSRQGFTKYLNENCFTPEEIDGAKQCLD